MGWSNSTRVRYGALGGGIVARESAAIGVVVAAAKAARRRARHAIVNDDVVSRPADFGETALAASRSDREVSDVRR